MYRGTVVYHCKTVLKMYYDNFVCDIPHNFGMVYHSTFTIWSTILKLIDGSAV